MTSQCISDPATRSDKNWFTRKTKRQNTDLTMWCMPYSAARNAQTSTLERPNSHFTSAWHNTEEPPCKARTLQSIYTYRPVDTLSMMRMFILDREERWFERGVKEAIYVKRERPSLNRGGGLRVHLSPSYNVVIAAIPQLSVNGTHGH